ncbi:MAG: hypothetical protein JST79_11310 [Acidobacteria bacterium]|nr:hypothetical protein [Acidobacteriota bacterium]
MTKTPETLELTGTIANHQGTTSGVETPMMPAPVVIATPQEIRTGSVLVKSDVRLPDSAGFESKRFGPWRLLTKADGFEVERALSEAGWHFFFMVPQIAFGALSVKPNKAIRAALKKVFVAVEKQGFNALEIAEVTAKGILGLHYVKVVVHARHVKNSPFLRDLDPYYVPRGVWNGKGVLRRRAEIGRMIKGI